MQTRVESLIEGFFNVGSGMFLSWLITLCVMPAFYGWSVRAGEAAEITMIYTVISVMRGYAWRRIFNRRVAIRVRG